MDTITNTSDAIEGIIHRKNVVILKRVFFTEEQHPGNRENLKSLFKET